MVKVILLLIIRQHLAHFLLGESYHLVEAEGKGVVGADIESACEIIEDHRAYSCDKDTLNR